MSVLSWVHSGEVVALGWTLLHFCWQSTVIALLYVLADRCLPHATTAVRYGLAMAMLSLMPIAAIATFAEQERLVVHITQGEQQVVASQVGSLHAIVVKDAPFAAPVMADGELWIASHANRLMPWIDGVWLAGVWLLALRAAGGWRRLRLLRRTAQLAVPAAVQKSFAKVIAQLRLVHPVVLRVSADVISPMALGIWHTSVILPLSVATSLPVEQLEAVLAHELAHIRRWDFFCNLVQTAIECLFFFHPAVWWLSRRTRELREVCCDEIAARTCVEPSVYAEALLQLEEQRAEHLQLAVALHGRGGALLHRIRRVMGEKTMEQRSMSGVQVKLNGILQHVPTTPGSYLELKRKWHDGDRLEVSLPMNLHTAPLPDDETLQAAMYGPLVLAARMGSNRLTKEMIYGDSEPDAKRQKALPMPEVIGTSDPTSWLAKTPGQALGFQTVGQSETMHLIPLYKLLDERYSVYWKVQPKSA